MMKSKQLFSRTMLVSMLAICMASCKQQPAMPDENRYKTLTVAKTDRTVSTNYPATIQGRQDVDIYPQVSGLITQVNIAEGAAVKKGQVLFVIDQIPYKAALETALANVESAEANVATAQMTADSKVELYKENIVSAFEMQTAQNNLRQQKAVLAQARAELTNARNNLSYTEVRSPVDGTTGMIPHRIGTLVSPTMTTPLVSVSDDKEMYAYFSITEKQLLAFSRQDIMLSEALQNMPEVGLLLSDGSIYREKGKIDAVSGIIDKRTGAVTLRAVFPNPNHVLRSGSTGNIIFPNKKSNCIVIPQVATFELQDKIFVYKIVDGKTQSTPITVFPINNGKEYIVESGLAEGDIIIAEGAGLLREGVQVNNK